jgi:hypothetical protein
MQQNGFFFDSFLINGFSELKTSHVVYSESWHLQLPATLTFNIVRGVCNSAYQEPAPPPPPGRRSAQNVARAFCGTNLPSDRLNLGRLFQNTTTTKTTF